MGEIVANHILSEVNDCGKLMYYDLSIEKVRWFVLKKNQIEFIPEQVTGWQQR